MVYQVLNSILYRDNTGGTPPDLSTGNDDEREAMTTLPATKCRSPSGLFPLASTAASQQKPAFRPTSLVDQQSFAASITRVCYEHTALPSS